MHGTKLTDAQRREVKNLASQGLTGHAISELTGLAQGTISKILTAVGFKRYKTITRDSQPFTPDPPKEKIDRPKAVYSNPSREELISKILRNQNK